MKTILVLLVFGLGLSSCNNEATVTIKEDSLKKKVERVDREVDSVSEKMKDSVNQRWNELKEEIETKTEKKDSGK